MVSQTGDMPFTVLMDNVLNGKIRIPDFQRAVVWDGEDVETLLDSVIQEYPIGLLLLWESCDNLKERDPLDLKLQQNSKMPKLWLLDGQQRLISLVGSFSNKLILGKKKC